MEGMEKIGTYSSTYKRVTLEYKSGVVGWLRSSQRR
jgi:hypothetical protein